MNSPNKTGHSESERGSRLAHALTAIAGCLAMIAAPCASAGAPEQAKRIHDRLTGVPPSAQVLSDMSSDIAGGNPLGAAFRAMEADQFYNVTLKNFVTPWTNEERTVFAPLNDYTATVIGMIRDDVPFNQVLSEDILYVGAGGLGLPTYSMTNNDHYQQMEDRGLNLKTALTATTQSAVTDLPPSATAGVLTTRAAAEAFFVAGTNRAMFRFTLLNHLCTDLEQLKDTSYPPDRIRQDVTRSPGGDSRLFLNNCVGCHNGMDPLAQGFAYYNYDEAQSRMVYTPGQVQPKYLINAENFKFGYVTTNDNWQNYWRTGQNQLLGWDPNLPGSGSGAKSLGQELAGSQAFAECQVKKVFRNVCFRDPVDAVDRAQIQGMVGSFKGNNYSMKQVFAEAAVYCMGD
jgi:hypothetical protein